MIVPTQPGQRSLIFLYDTQEILEQIHALQGVGYLLVELDSKYGSTVMSHCFNGTTA